MSLMSRAREGCATGVHGIVWQVKLFCKKPQNYFQWVTNEKASDEIVDIGNDTTPVAILLLLTMAMTMPIEVTTAPIVMTESIVSTVMVMTLLF